MKREFKWVATFVRHIKEGKVVTKSHVLSARRDLHVHAGGAHDGATRLALRIIEAAAEAGAAWDAFAPEGA